MSGVGGGSGGDMVVQELVVVRVKIEKLEKAIEVQQQKLEAAEGNDARWELIATAVAADKQRLVELQRKENRLAEQQREQQQQQPQTQGGKCCPRSLSLGPSFYRFYCGCSSAFPL